MDRLRANAKIHRPWVATVVLDPRGSIIPIGQDRENSLLRFWFAVTTNILRKLGHKALTVGCHCLPLWKNRHAPAVGRKKNANCAGNLAEVSPGCAALMSFKGDPFSARPMRPCAKRATEEAF